MQEKEHILEILEQTKRAIKEEDVIKLKELSNNTIHTSSIYQDPDNIALAVIIYSLSKIIERRNYKEYKEFDSFKKTYEKSIHKSIQFLKNNELEQYREQINQIRKTIEQLSGKLKVYIQDVFRKAQINKASRIYEHGISIEQTAKILGISVWELAEYAGKTGISNVNLSVTLPVKKRIKLTEDFFKK